MNNNDYNSNESLTIRMNQNAILGGKETKKSNITIKLVNTYYL